MSNLKNRDIISNYFQKRFPKSYAPKRIENFIKFYNKQFII